MGAPTDKIPKTQKAAVVRDKKVAIEDVPVVQPSDLKVGQVLVKVLYSGVCHTDLHAQLGDWPLVHKEPLIGGHEGAGIIVAIGEHTDTDLKLGDRVGIKWLADSCLKCDYCRQGYEPLCHQAQCSGFTVDGSFQQYAVSFARHVTKIPEGLPMDKAAPILCAGVTVYKALKQSNARPGEWVVIPGAGGGLGHLAIQYAQYMGLRVIAIDTGAEKQALCTKLGAERWIDFRQTDDIVKAVKAATPDGDGPHAAIVTSASGAAYEQALDYIRPHGTVVSVGLPPDAKVSADVFWTTFLEKQLKGSYVGNRQDAVEALAIAASGRVETTFRLLPFANLPDVYAQMHDGSLVGRVVLDLWA
ncbi:GroES-like protein [Calocera cornea HHB12733]|uniref:alcohol dehydrogenase n=1 Tax=Calocera cornea HHB12733 TaxID=1353952 RepID=A0A165DW51_9BASI|nr:GroES-like protein [Calocera cornea HHB12733]